VNVETESGAGRFCVWDSGEAESEAFTPGGRVTLKHYDLRHPAELEVALDELEGVLTARTPRPDWSRTYTTSRTTPGWATESAETFRAATLRAPCVGGWSGSTRTSISERAPSEFRRQPYCWRREISVGSTNAWRLPGKTGAIFSWLPISPTRTGDRSSTENSARR
jgi:hypothetical protein